MGDVLVGILQRVGEVVHGIDAPCAARVVVFREHDAVQHGVPHVHVAGGHVYFGAQNGFSFRDFPVFHGLKACQVFFHGTVPVGGFLAGHVHVAALGAYFLHRLFVHVGQSLVDEGDGAFVKEIEHVAGKKEIVPPVEAQPADVFLDAVHIFLVFLAGVGVVKAQVAARARKFLGDTEIEADGFGMSDMEVTIGFRRKAGYRCLMLAGGKVIRNHIADEISAFGRLQ